MSILSSFLAVKTQVERLSHGKSTLLVVTKQQPIEHILPILKAGHLSFAENRVQEALQKWPYLKTLYPKAELHLIGPLQTNKVRDAMKVFTIIETVDRVQLAEALAKEMARRAEKPSCYIQINIGDEPQKTGISLKEADHFIDYCCHDLQLPIKGLMCIPPVAEEATSYFTLLAAIAERHHLPIRSMGMSNDYTTAIASGATHVRIGSAIFGERAKK